VRPPADFRLVQRVSRAAWRSAFNHHVSESHVDLLRSFRFSFVRGISAAPLILWRNAPKLARQLIQAVAECGNWLLLVMLSSGDVKGALRLFRELLCDEWSVTMLWLNTRLAPWCDDPIACTAKLVNKRKRNKQKHWLQKQKQSLQKFSHL
jgi:hypothetical protein